MRHWHWTTSSVKRDPVMKKYHVYQKSLGNDLKWISRKYMVSMLDLCEWNKLPVETPDQVSVVSVCVYAVCVCVCVCVFV